MTAENLVKCTKLYDFYTNGFAEAKFDQHARVFLPEIESTNSRLNEPHNPHHYSAPSLMDLVHRENIHTSADDVRAEEWFENTIDPYNLAEADDVGHIVRSSDRWEVADFVKLSDHYLLNLINRLGGDDKPHIKVVWTPLSHTNEVSSTTGHPSDWEVV